MEALPPAMGGSVPPLLHIKVPTILVLPTIIEGGLSGVLPSTTFPPSSSNNVLSWIAFCRCLHRWPTLGDPVPLLSSLSSADVSAPLPSDITISFSDFLASSQGAPCPVLVLGRSQVTSPSVHGGSPPPVLVAFPRPAVFPGVSPAPSVAVVPAVVPPPAPAVVPPPAPVAVLPPPCSCGGSTTPRCSCPKSTDSCRASQAGSHVGSQSILGFP